MIRALPFNSPLDSFFMTTLSHTLARPCHLGGSSNAVKFFWDMDTKHTCLFWKSMKQYSLVFKLICPTFSTYEVIAIDVETITILWAVGMVAFIRF